MGEIRIDGGMYGPSLNDYEHNNQQAREKSGRAPDSKKEVLTGEVEVKPKAPDEESGNLVNEIG